MHVIMNLGLDGPTVLVDRHMTVEQRLAAYMPRLDKLFPHGYVGWRVDDTFIVSGQLVPAEPLLFSLHDLALAANQDCIAVLYTGTGVGRLAGPHADSWGLFDMAYFKMPPA